MNVRTVGLDCRCHEFLQGVTNSKSHKSLRLLFGVFSKCLCYCPFVGQVMSHSNGRHIIGRYVGMSIYLSDQMSQGSKVFIIAP